MITRKSISHFKLLFRLKLTLVILRKTVLEPADHQKKKSSKSIQDLIDQAVATLKMEYGREINILKAEVNEIKNSQEFICKKYDSLKVDHDKLSLINQVQEKETATLKSQATELKEQRVKESVKLDDIEQYGRRQNIEIVGVPMHDGEDTNAIVREVGNLLNVEVLPCHMSISHRLPVKPKNKTPNPSIIARFVNRDIRNKLYANRKLLRSIDLSKFSITGTEKIYVNENLTQLRKKLFWQTKVKAKKMNYKYYWSMNNNIYIKIST